MVDLTKRSIVTISGHKDDSFKEFRRLCAALAVTPSYLAKTELVRKLFSKGTDGDKFKGDLLIWVRLLLPGVIKRIYNLQSKQVLKKASLGFEWLKCVQWPISPDF